MHKIQKMLKVLKFQKMLKMHNVFKMLRLAGSISILYLYGPPCPPSPFYVCVSLAHVPLVPYINITGLIQYIVMYLLSFCF